MSTYSIRVNCMNSVNDPVIPVLMVPRSGFASTGVAEGGLAPAPLSSPVHHTSLPPDPPQPLPSGVHHDNPLPPLQSTSCPPQPTASDTHLVAPPTT